MPDRAEPNRDPIPGAEPAPPTPTTAAARRLRRLGSGFTLLVALSYCLIVLGALVRANQAGLACPDWPLCFGEVIPRLDVKVAFEWSHRLIAGGVAIAFVVLAAQVLQLPAAPRSSVVLIAVAAGLLVTQILLGALTVWLQLASWTVTGHLVTGNSFALTLLLIACALRSAAVVLPARAAAPAAVRGWVLAAAAVLLLQMVLGGLVSSRYAGLACPEWPACNGGLWIPTWGGSVGLHLLHRFNAYLLVTLLAIAALVCRREPDLRKPTALALIFGLCEVTVGVANVLLGIPAEITGLHTALAAALVLSLTLAVRDLFTRRTAAL
jgi:cytochrome c oxidase assembly protein subunit 15